MKLTVEQKTVNIRDHVVTLCPGSEPFVSAHYYLHSREGHLVFSCCLYKEGVRIPPAENLQAYCQPYEYFMSLKEFPLC